MIGREILCSFCVNYFEFELLKEENPPEQSHLRVFFSKEIFEGGVIRIHNAFVQDKELPSFFRSLHVVSNHSPLVRASVHIAEPNGMLNTVANFHKDTRM
ncbi:hypothetical protein Tco_0770439 [Tanacetum coccineum]|uniref:Uncharacterized protein n=1 Tax=Tanacetum coccineum TaxID=301880 RepID=A0ABQ4ZG41_9ASTR